MNTNTKFVDCLKNILTLNTVYMWGEFGRKVTNNTINAKKKQYPSHYPEQRVKYLKTLVGRNFYAYDCAGLIKAYWMSNYGKTNVVYNSKYDKDAYDITVGNASEKGNIDSLPEIPGILLYMKGHCGIYIGNGNVIEATADTKLSGSLYGKVCQTKLKDRKWLYWVMSKWLIYEDNTKYYIVKKGDTLTSIAKKYNLTIYDIARVNNINNINLIFINQRLIIPSGTESNIKHYVVKRGDTLVSIAKKNNTTWRSIYQKNINTIKDPNLIYPGQKIII